MNKIEINKANITNLGKPCSLCGTPLTVENTVYMSQARWTHGKMVLASRCVNCYRISAMVANYKYKDIEQIQLQRAKYLRLAAVLDYVIEFVSETGKFDAFEISKQAQEDPRCRS